MYTKKKIKIYEALVSGKGVNHIIQVSSKVIGNPISLSDSSYKLIDYSTDIEVNDPIWNNIISFGYSSLEVVKQFNKENIIERVIQSDLPIIIDKGIGEDMTRILGKVTISGKVVAYLGVFEVNHKLKKEDIILSQVICSVLSVELSKNPAIANLSSSLHENLIIDLLYSYSMDKFTLKERLRSASWNILENFQLVYIPIEEGSIANFKVKYLRSYLNDLSPYFKSVYFDRSIILVVNFKNEEDLDNSWDHIKSLLESHKLKAGVSFSFTDLRKLKKHYKNALISYNLGSSLNKELNLYYFEEYYSLYLLDQISSYVSLEDYCHKGILNLIEADNNNSTDYANTLYEYINNAYNLTKTSKKLYIHKNTMLYRLNRIKEISKINSLEDEDSFNMHLTYEIINYIKVSKENLFVN